MIHGYKNLLSDFSTQLFGLAENLIKSGLQCRERKLYRLRMSGRTSGSKIRSEMLLFRFVLVSMSGVWVDRSAQVDGTNCDNFQARLSFNLGIV